MKDFATSQFQYCPLVWMFYSRKMSNKINRLHERALRIAHKDHISTFVALLEKYKSVTIHQKNLQLLMTEMFKTPTSNLIPSCMDEIFPQRSVNYNLKNTNTFSLPLIHTVDHGTETIRYGRQRIWHSLPQEIKNSNSVQQHIRTKSNIGITKAAIADYAGCTFLKSAFYGFTMPFCITCGICNFIDLFYLYIFKCWLGLAFIYIYIAM